MMRPDDPAQRRAAKLVLLCGGVAVAIGFPFVFLPLEYTVIFVAVAILLGAIVRWRWGEEIDRRMLELFQITDED